MCIAVDRASREKMDTVITTDTGRDDSKEAEDLLINQTQRSQTPRSSEQQDLHTVCTSTTVTKTVHLQSSLKHQACSCFVDASCGPINPCQRHPFWSVLIQSGPINTAETRMLLLRYTTEWATIFTSRVLSSFREQYKRALMRSRVLYYQLWQFRLLGWSSTCIHRPRVLEQLPTPTALLHVIRLRYTASSEHEWIRGLAEFALPKAPRTAYKPSSQGG